MKIITRAARSIKTLFSKNQGFGSLGANDDKVDKRFGI